MSAADFILISKACLAAGIILLLASGIIWFAGHISLSISELKGKKTKPQEKLRVIEDLMIVNSKEWIDY